jgi:hypothetical protein
MTRVATAIATPNRPTSQDPDEPLEPEASPGAPDEVEYAVNRTSATGTRHSVRRRRNHVLPGRDSDALPPMEVTVRRHGRRNMGATPPPALLATPRTRDRALVGVELRKAPGQPHLSHLRTSTTPPSGSSCTPCSPPSPSSAPRTAVPSHLHDGPERRPHVPGGEPWLWGSWSVPGMSGTATVACVRFQQGAGGPARSTSPRCSCLLPSGASWPMPARGGATRGSPPLHPFAFHPRHRRAHRSHVASSWSEGSTCLAGRWTFRPMNPRPPGWSCRRAM